MDIPEEVYDFIKTLNAGLSYENEKNKIISTLLLMRHCLDTNFSMSDLLSNHDIEHNFTENELILFKKHIQSSHYLKSEIFSSIIKITTYDWISKISSESFNKHVTVIFKEGPVEDSFMSLMQSVEVLR